MYVQFYIQHSNKDSFRKGYHFELIRAQGIWQQGAFGVRRRLYKEKRSLRYRNEILKDAGLTVFELSGVEPNPKIETVRKGVEICKMRVSTWCLQ